MEDTTPGPSRTALPVISNSQISVASISDIKCGDTVKFLIYSDFFWFEKLMSLKKSFIKIITAEVIERDDDRQSLSETISKQSLREIAQETADDVTTGKL